MTQPSKQPIETRAEQIARLEASGDLDPNCLTCQEEVYSRKDRKPSEVFMPRHKASPRCESGKRSHCTCDTCFFDPVREARWLAAFGLAHVLLEQDGRLGGSHPATHSRRSALYFLERILLASASVASSLERLKKKKNDILGDRLVEYLEESIHQSWEGFSPRDMTGVRRLLEDFALFVEEYLEP